MIHCCSIEIFYVSIEKMSVQLNSSSTLMLKYAQANLYIWKSSLDVVFDHYFFNLFAVPLAAWYPKHVLGVLNG